MNSLAEYYEKDTAIKKKTKSALSYPIMLGGLTVAIVVLMMVFVVPTFRKSLSSLDVQATGITKAVYDISDFMVASWQYILGGILAIILGIVIAKKTPKGSYFFDWLKVNMPLVRKISMDTVAARFARGFGLLLSSGMDITDALDAMTIVFGNQDVVRRFKLASEDVRHGMMMALAFDKYKLFPPILVQMVAVGEKTASLDDVLTRSCVFFDEAVQESLTSLTSKIQPTMLIILGGVIGVLFLAIYSPMLSIMQSLG